MLIDTGSFRSAYRLTCSILISWPLSYPCTAELYEEASSNRDAAH